jgi:dimethylargininase
MFKQTIVRLPGPEMIRGLSSASLGKPDLGKALDQHEAYVKTLQSCGLEVRVLEADARFPDGCFVEDVALCTPVCAIVTNPGAPSRNAEKQLMEPLLREYYGQVESITAPGTLDAGDVMMVGKHYYIGISGAHQPGGCRSADPDPGPCMVCPDPKSPCTRCCI